MDEVIEDVDVLLKTNMESDFFRTIIGLADGISLLFTELCCWNLLAICDTNPSFIGLEPWPPPASTEVGVESLCFIWKKQQQSVRS